MQLAHKHFGANAERAEAFVVYDFISGPQKTIRRYGMLVNQTNNQTFQFRMCTDEQLHRLHFGTLEVLERTGVKIFDPEALQLLKDGGAYVNEKEKIARIPAWMVEEAIRTAPSRIVVANQKGERKLFLERNRVYYGTGTDLPSFTDVYTNKVRPTVLKDIENVAKVVEQADNFDYVSNSGLASDIPQELHDLISLKVLRSYSTKPNLTTATDRGNLKALIDMAAEMAGGYEELRRSPTLMLYNEPVSPLLNSKEALQKLLLCAEYGIPTTYAAGGVSGGTSPVTLSGSIIQSNAEGLAGLVMHQLKRKGAPFIFGYVFGAMDMKTTVNLYGGPELGMVHAVMAELGKFYGLPIYGTSGCTDALQIDAQAGLEAMYSIMCAGLSGANLVHDNGYTGIGMIGNLEMILLSNESISYMKRLTQGIKYDDESFAIDLIDKVGYGGDFISQKHTMKHFKEELFYPTFMNRKQYPAWQLDGEQTLNQKLKKRAIEIVENDSPVLLSDHTLKVFDEIIKDRERELELEKNK